MSFIETVYRCNHLNIKAAGPRYTPVVDPQAPNIKIDFLLESIHALSLSETYRSRILELRKDFEKKWNRVPNNIVVLFKGKKWEPSQLIQLLITLGSESPGHSSLTLTNINRAYTTCRSVLNEKYFELTDLQRKYAMSSEDYKKLQTEIDSITEAERCFVELRQFIESSSFDLIGNNCLFIKGEWGTGKTHLLCDITREYMLNDFPIAFALAHRLPGKKHLERNISEGIGATKTLVSLLKRLNSLGRKQNRRALLVIDGINEGHRTKWKQGLPNLLRTLKAYPNVGLVLSCRSTFEQRIVSSGSAKRMVEIIHTGFDEIEFDAQLEFFNYYQIPLPHVPLLTPEFSRPLFLKIMCESLSGLTRTLKSRKIEQIASGQKGMTKLLEDFVCKVGEKIERDFTLSAKTCWRIMKGGKSLLSEEECGIAPIMAKNLKDYVTPEQYRHIVMELSGIRNVSRLNKLCSRLITDGLLVEDSVWEKSGVIDVVRLPYQRFSDHLICRHLLDKFLSTTSTDSIKRSFYSNRPLGKIFKVVRSGNSYVMPGLASAIMLEFPERVKKRVSPDDRELVYYLPKKSRLIAPSVEVFFEGLLWRSADSFSKRTEDMMLQLLRVLKEGAQRNAFEALVSLGTRPSQQFSAQWLYNSLFPMTITDRDISWSEYLRKTGKASAVSKIFAWVEGGANRIKPAIADNLIRLCSLMLTTTDRPLRDRATKSIVLLGSRAPKALFNVTKDTFSFNDPYVRERMMAAVYGVLMREWAFPSVELKNCIGEFARWIYDNMFGKRAPYATKHILIQDYALGVIELAIKIDSTCLDGRPLKYLKRPFSRHPSNIPEADQIDPNECAKANNAIHMDFENYTVGGLVDGRGNYNMEHQEYKNVLNRIKWRILDLGYNNSKFDEIEATITQPGGRVNQRGKTDRYGKKYSWISYFEMCGTLADHGLLPDLKDDHRVADCDIDPSFPNLPKVWKPQLNPLFQRRYGSPLTWSVKGPTPSYEHLVLCEEIDGHPGPWVLLDGYIEENAPRSNDPRHVYTFLRGLLTKPSHKKRIETNFHKIEYPGNTFIPDKGRDIHIYAGEIPWSKRYNIELYGNRQKKKIRDVQDAFELPILVRKRMKFSELDFLDQLQYSVRTGAPERKYVTVERHYNSPGVKIEMPVYTFGWEGHRSNENRTGSIVYLAPSICEFLNLKNRENSFDLVDEIGNVATLYREFKDGSVEKNWGDSHLLYIRKDLLDRYLVSSKQEIVWTLWGERTFKLDLMNSIRDEARAIRVGHRNVHKQFIKMKDIQSSTMELPLHP